MSNQSSTMYDGKCSLEFIVGNEGEEKKVACKFISNGLARINEKPTTEFTFSFLIDEDAFNVDNVYLGIVNHLLHNLYDHQAMNNDEEWAFCMLNEELADNMKAWEQGAFYMSNKEKLYHRNPIGDSATDFIRCTELKLKNFISLNLQK